MPGADHAKRLGLAETPDHCPKAPKHLDKGPSDLLRKHRIADLCARNLPDFSTSPKRSIRLFNCVSAASTSRAAVASSAFVELFYKRLECLLAHHCVSSEGLADKHAKRIRFARRECLADRPRCPLGAGGLPQFFAKRLGLPRATAMR